MRFFSNLFLITLLVFSPSVFAETKDFTIRVSGGIDVTPPTTPVLDSVVPVSDTQMDVAWQVSTDDLIVSGYVLYRDGLALATTTLTSYSDTGLAASTTYSYFVKAFDPSLNYSSSSNVIASTTLNPPPVATSTHSQGTAVRAVLDSFSIQESYTSAILNISTSYPTRIEVRWGRTSSYELGYVVNDRFLSTHETRITELEPGTTYEYQVIGYTPRGAETLLKRGQFTTLSTTDVTNISNVKRFKGFAEDANVRLSWELPDLKNISYVRIVRSYFSFPTTLQNGSIVYQGLGTSYVDVDILDRYSPVYYTAFVVDTEGNVSSGAVTVVYAVEDIRKPSSNSSPLDVTPVKIFDENAIFEDPDKTDNLKDFRIPDLTDIYITQADTGFTFADESVTLSTGVAYKISIPKETVANNLKSILFTITDPSDTREQYSYLLKINKDQSAYESVIPAMEVAGSSWALLDIYDYESRIVSSYRKKVSFGDNDRQQDKVLFPDMLIENAWITFSFLLLLLLWVLFVLRRSRK